MEGGGPDKVGPDEDEDEDKGKAKFDFPSREATEGAKRKAEGILSP